MSGPAVRPTLSCYLLSTLGCRKKTQRRQLSNLHFLAGRVCDSDREPLPVSSFRKPIYLWIRWPEPQVNITLPSANHLSIFYCEIFFKVHKYDMTMLIKKLRVGICWKTKLPKFVIFEMYHRAASLVSLINLCSYDLHVPCQIEICEDLPN